MVGLHDQGAELDCRGCPGQIWDNLNIEIVIIVDCVYVCVCVCMCVSHSVVSNSATPWTEAGQAPLSMGFSRQEYWSG